MNYLDIKKFRQTQRQTDPFDYMMVPDFLRPERVREVINDFPAITEPGNFPIDELAYGPHFEAVIDETRGSEFREAVEEKFGVNLDGLHHVITIRGRSQKSDGNIHSDTPAKIITALVYLNECWHADGGCLRLLRSSRSLDDYVAEVAPLAGTLFAFKRSDESWHGYRPYEGPRRMIQINWIDESVAYSHYKTEQAGRRLKRWLRTGA